MIYIELDEYELHDRLKKAGHEYTLNACREIINDAIELNEDMEFCVVDIASMYVESTCDEIKHEYKNYPDIVECIHTYELVSVLSEYTTARVLSNGNILYTPF